MHNGNRSISKRISTAVVLACILVWCTQELNAQWQQQTSFPFTGYVKCFTAGSNGTGGTNFFAGTITGGVFLSNDNGSTWTAVNNGLVNLNVQALAVIGTSVFAGTGSGVFLSNDNGGSWSAVNSGLTNLNVQALNVSGTNLYAGTNGGGIFLSSNNGASWTAINSSGLTNKNILSLATGTAVSGGSNLIAGTSKGAFLSTDNGLNWTGITAGITFNVVKALAICANGTGGTNLFAGYTYGGVYLSSDNGMNWNAVDNGLLYPDVSSFAVSPNGTGIPNLFVGTNGGGVFLTTDNASNWVEVNTGFAEGNSGLTSTPIPALAVNGTYLYAGGSNGLWRRPVKEMLPNQTPVANAGPDQTVFQNGTGGAQVLLNGSGSSDPDGDALTYVWKEGTTQIATGANPTTALTAGIHTIVLSVSDNRGGESSDNVTITVPANRPPVASAGPDQTVEQTSTAGASVTLDGSSSSDPDGDVLTYVWTEGTTQLAAVMKPAVSLSAGTHAIVLTVSDGKGGTSADTATIRVVDTTPPAIKVVSTPRILWPPDHKYVTVKVADIVTSVSDAGSPSIPISSVSIKSVSSDEPMNANGDGNTANDIMISDDAKSVDLRAERQDKGNGRVYTMSVAVKDANGNVGNANYEVWVPKDKNDKTVVNNGPVYTVVANSAVADAGTAQTVEQTSVLGAQVTLDGSKSYDPNRPILTYVWTDGRFTLGTTVKPTVFLLPGSHKIVLTVSDCPGGGVSTDTVIIKIVDTTPPVITVSSTPTILWPVDNNFDDVDVSKIVTSVSDVSIPCLLKYCVDIDSVSSDEPAGKDGHGHTLSDINISKNASSVDLRAARQSGGNGRVYTIYLSVKDASGNVGKASYQVLVPINKNDKTVPNDGIAYVVVANSTQQDFWFSKQGSDLSLPASEQPDEFKLYDNYPNPFNPSTEIRFAIQTDNFVSLKVYTLTGREVATLANGPYSAGRYSVQFHADKLASGIYIYRLTAGNFVQSKKMLLVK